MFFLFRFLAFLWLLTFFLLKMSIAVLAVCVYIVKVFFCQITKKKKMPINSICRFGTRYDKKEWM